MNQFYDDVELYTRFAHGISLLIADGKIATKEMVVSCIRTGQLWEFILSVTYPKLTMGPTDDKQIKFFNESFRKMYDRWSHNFSDIDVNRNQGLHWVLEGSLFVIKGIIAKGTYMDHREDAEDLSSHDPYKEIDEMNFDEVFSPRGNDEEPSESEMWEHHYEYGERHDD